jgi:hypothetical protein
LIGYLTTQRDALLPAPQTQLLLFILLHCDDTLLAKIRDFTPS